MGAPLTDEQTDNLISKVADDFFLFLTEKATQMGFMPNLGNVLCFLPAEEANGLANHPIRIGYVRGNNVLTFKIVGGFGDEEIVELYFDVARKQVVNSCEYDHYGKRLSGKLGVFTPYPDWEEDYLLVLLEDLNNRSLYQVVTGEKINEILQRCVIQSVA